MLTARPEHVQQAIDIPEIARRCCECGERKSMAEFPRLFYTPSRGGPKRWLRAERCINCSVGRG